MLAVITIVITTVMTTILPNFLEWISVHNLGVCHLFLWLSPKVDMLQGAQMGNEILVQNISTA